MKAICSIGWLRMILMCALTLLVSGCATLQQFAPYVELSEMSAEEYLVLKRGDILTQGEISVATREVIRVAGLDEGPCTKFSSVCIDALSASIGITAERRLSSLSELWVAHAQTLRDGDEMLSAWLEAARYAYAYLLYEERGPEERAFEDRQTQARDWYNHAVQKVVQALFDRYAELKPLAYGDVIHVAGWSITLEATRQYSEHAADSLKELIPAASLAFSGLRSVYRRDGLGAELVAVLPETETQTAPDATMQTKAQPWSEMPSPVMTVLLHFSGEDLESVLRTKHAKISAHDPYVDHAVSMHGHRVPLAANFTVGYGLWLARSGFANQSLRNLFGRDRGIRQPHVYLLQPYTPNKRVIVMLHGLASSPEAWVNLANEILGDEQLREEFQIWLVYYPTNLPIALNHVTIRDALQKTQDHFDPQRQAQASDGVVLVGHSMGGILSRLLVSTADEQFVRAVIPDDEVEDPESLAKLRQRFSSLLRFDPYPGVERAIFIATPHRGSPVATQRLGRWVAQMIRLPISVMQRFSDMLEDVNAEDENGSRRQWRIPNSIENLDAKEPFLRAAAELPIAPHVRYHSIVARQSEEGALLDSDDGLVPYDSAHLRDAESEKVIVSGHSVQQTAPAIIEIRRILHQDIAERTQN